NLLQRIGLAARDLAAGLADALGQPWRREQLERLDQAVVVLLREQYRVSVTVKDVMVAQLYHITYVRKAVHQAASACASVKRPLQSALPTTAPSHPSSRIRRRSSSSAIPPAARTGRPAPSTSSSSARSGPASEPS